MDARLQRRLLRTLGAPLATREDDDQEQEHADPDEEVSPAGRVGEQERDDAGEQKRRQRHDPEGVPKPTAHAADPMRNRALSGNPSGARGTLPLQRSQRWKGRCELVATKTIRLAREKETKGTVRFQELGDADELRMIYVPKRTIAELGDPTEIEITLAAAA